MSFYVLVISLAVFRPCDAVVRDYVPSCKANEPTVEFFLSKDSMLKERMYMTDRGDKSRIFKIHISCMGEFSIKEIKEELVNTEKEIDIPVKE